MATVEGRRLRLGTARFLAQTVRSSAEQTEVWLEVDGEVKAVYRFIDRLRPEAAHVVAELQKRGLKVLIASGDHTPAVAAVARRVGIADFRGDCLPPDKAAWVRDLQSRGARVAVVGDGLNDAPALTAAQLGVVVHKGSELSTEVAGMVLLRPGLMPLLEALDLSHDAWSRLRFNLATSVLYNLIALPLAMTGWVTPLLAAIAMPLSSLVVVLNSVGRRWKS